MHQYFFDLVGQNSCERDYRGRLFRNVDDAMAHAELIALDVEMRSTGNYSGLQIHCCDPHGATVGIVAIDMAVAA